MPRVRDVFRERGFDGASLTVLAEATQLGRATLYHHFPGGKEEMAQAAMSDVETGLADALLAPLRAPGSVAHRLQGMIAALDGYYRGGRANCLLGVLALNRSDHGLEPRVAAAFRAWVAALAAIAREADMPDADARAEDAVVAIQGGLVLAAGLNDPAPFQRALGRVPGILLG